MSDFRRSMLKASEKLTMSKASSQDSYLDRLPFELLIQVLSDLDNDSLLQCAVVSRQMSQVAQSLLYQHLDLTLASSLDKYGTLCSESLRPTEETDGSGHRKKLKALYTKLSREKFKKDITFRTLEERVHHDCQEVRSIRLGSNNLKTWEKHVETLSQILGNLSEIHIDINMVEENGGSTIADLRKIYGTGLFTDNLAWLYSAVRAGIISSTLKPFEDLVFVDGSDFGTEFDMGWFRAMSINKSGADFVVSLDSLHRPYQHFSHIYWITKATQKAEKISLIFADTDGSWERAVFRSTDADQRVGGPSENDEVKNDKQVDLTRVESWIFRFLETSSENVKVDVFMLNTAPMGLATRRQAVDSNEEEEYEGLADIQYPHSDVESAVRNRLRAGNLTRNIDFRTRRDYVTMKPRPRHLRPDHFDYFRGLEHRPLPTGEDRTYLSGSFIPTQGSASVEEV